MSAATDRLRGSIPPLVTPFINGEVDYEAYARLVTIQIEKGSHGILVNGTTSEPATLTIAERNRLVDVALSVAAKRVPVVAATGSQSLAETKLLTEHAAKAAADALLIVTPYYTRPPQRGLVAYYLEIAKISDLPWMVYHIPGRTAVGVTLDTLKELKAKSPAFVGMKHAVNDLGFVSECLATFGQDFKIFVGLEELSFPMMAVGACGLMNAVGNLSPGILSEMCDAVWNNDLSAAQLLHQRLFEINQACFDTNPIPIKYMMKRLGILPTNEHRLPMVPATAELAKRLDAVLRRAPARSGKNGMKIATFEVNARTSYGIVKGEGIVDAGSHLGDRFPDLRSVIVAGQLHQLEDLAANAPADFRLNDIRLLKPILNPGKILCVGINYPEREAEYKNKLEPSTYPSIFVRFPGSLVAHEELIVRPPESKQLDYEGEVALVIGRPGRRISEGDAMSHVAGYTICNEGTIRDWLRHGKFNVTPGKNFDKSGSLGPWIVTREEIGADPLQIITRVNGDLRQSDTTDRMIFSMSFLISYISRFCTLEAGDIIITGTPSGAGARLDPPQYLIPGDVVEVEVPAIGTLRNRVIDEPVG